MAKRKLVKKGDTIFYLMQIEGNEIDIFKGTFDLKRKMVPLTKMLKAFPEEIVKDLIIEKTTVHVVNFIGKDNDIPVIEI